MFGGGRPVWRAVAVGAKLLIYDPIQRTQASSSVRTGPLGDASRETRGGRMGATGTTIGAAVAAVIGLTALPASAAPLTALTAHDLALYANAFQAAERGDNAAADQAV